MQAIFYIPFKVVENSTVDRGINIKGLIVLVCTSVGVSPNGVDSIVAVESVNKL